jgi:hypothetical protein
MFTAGIAADAPTLIDGATPASVMFAAGTEIDLPAATLGATPAIVMFAAGALIVTPLAVATAIGIGTSLSDPATIDPSHPVVEPLNASHAMNRASDENGGFIPRRTHSNQRC